ncbi:MAG: ornithine cyclodeaminase [bacterium]|nr:ornithine cyclodeaminase [bacterium]
MKIITIESLTQLLHRHGFNNFMNDLMKTLRYDFSRSHTFSQIPRPAMHVPGGVLELMPLCDNTEYFSYKYVNCHPLNPLKNKMTVVATGQLSRIDTGYPVMFSEMTLLTALRTAATSALATDLLARKDAKIAAIIGNGAQSEFQVKALQLVRDIKTVRYFDIDLNAMTKFAHNLANLGIKLIACKDAESAVYGADIITVCTADKANREVLKDKWIHEGVHINALGGDTVGKTELELGILYRSKIVVEFFEQSFIEGEIQKLERKEALKRVHAQLNEIINNKKKGREHDEEITLFDSVGIGLEDYSALTLVYNLAKKYSLGEHLSIVPELTNPKNLFSLIQ